MVGCVCYNLFLGLQSVFFGGLMMMVLLCVVCLVCVAGVR